MSIPLKQSTAVEVALGPFLDSTDGVTAETGLTISQADVRLKKNGGDWAQKAETTTMVHEENGWYRCLLDATDTDTLGILKLAIAESGALPVWETFVVLAANVYDSLYGGGDTLDVQVTGIGANVITATSINADAITAAKVAADVTTEIQSGLATAAALDAVDNFIDTEISTIISTLGTPAGASISADIAAIEAQTDDIGAAGAGLTAIPWNAAWDAEVESEATDALNAYDPPNRAEASADKNEIIAFLSGMVIAKGTIGATGNTTTTVHLEGLTYGDDEINNYLIAIKDVSTGEWHARYIEDWADTGDLVTVATLPFTPESSVDAYAILAFRQDVTGGSGLDAAGVRAAVGLASANLDTQLGTIDTNVDAILVDTGTTLDGKIDVIDGIVDSILVDTGTTLDGRIPAALVGGRMDSSVGAMATDVLTAAALATSAVQELRPRKV